jgi:hypothetical protein
MPPPPPWAAVGKLAVTNKMRITTNRKKVLTIRIEPLLKLNFFEMVCINLGVKAAHLAKHY